MPVRFDSTELIPAPLVEIQKSLTRAQDGTPLTPEYVFTLNGTIVNVDTSKDSPDALDYTGLNGPTMEGVLAEQKRIREIFANADGGRLEIETPDGGGPNTIDAYCTVENISFNPGVWVNRCDYSIVLRSKYVEDDPDEVQDIESYTEDWSINENEDGTFLVTHTLQAIGNVIYGPLGKNNPRENARTWCLARLTSISVNGALSTHEDIISATLTPITGYEDSYWNLAVSEGIGTSSNSWQITETFIHNPNANYREEHSISVNSESQDNRLNISINGSVIGFASRASDSDAKSTRAKTAFDSSVEPNIITRVSAKVPSGYTLNPVPTVKQVTYQESAGIITYNYNYSSIKGNLIPNAIEESITIDDVGITDVFATIQVPGRANGPIVQYMNTVSLPERTVSINATVSVSGTLSLGSLATAYLSKPNTDLMVEALKPSAGYYYIRQNTESWNPMRGQYARQASWVLQPEGQSVSGLPIISHNLSTV